ncbi:dentin sialophosphoprotein-like [Diorhabda sublineata]|uniref:dentin sialophosphoprotein-like n=1 Tax=Diorhabda sublineata TaxID=1163346 RepID=UPI0024E0D5DB|nr:dentin sialophosphoprotein-like [Diorhabda sublineata]
MQCMKCWVDVKEYIRLHCYHVCCSKCYANLKNSFYACTICRELARHLLAQYGIQLKESSSEESSEVGSSSDENETSEEKSIEKEDTNPENNEKELSQEDVKPEIHEEELPQEHIKQEIHEEELPQKNVKQEIHEEELPQKNVKQEIHEEELPQKNVKQEIHEEELPQKHIKQEIYEEELPQRNIKPEIYEKELPQIVVKPEIYKEELSQDDFESIMHKSSLKREKQKHLIANNEKMTFRDEIKTEVEEITYENLPSTSNYNRSCLNTNTPQQISHIGEWNTTSRKATNGKSHTPGYPKPSTSQDVNLFNRYPESSRQPNNVSGSSLGPCLKSKEAAQLPRMNMDQNRESKKWDRTDGYPKPSTSQDINLFNRYPESSRQPNNVSGSAEGPCLKSYPKSQRQPNNVSGSSLGPCLKSKEAAQLPRMNMDQNRESKKWDRTDGYPKPSTSQDVNLFNRYPESSRQPNNVSGSSLGSCLKSKEAAQLPRVNMDQNREPKKWDRADGYPKPSTSQDVNLFNRYPESSRQPNNVSGSSLGPCLKSKEAAQLPRINMDQNSDFTKWKNTFGYPKSQRQPNNVSDSAEGACLKKKEVAQLPTTNIDQNRESKKWNRADGYPKPSTSQDVNLFNRYPESSRQPNNVSGSSLGPCLKSKEAAQLPRINMDQNREPKKWDRADGYPKSPRQPNNVSGSAEGTYLKSKEAAQLPTTNIDQNRESKNCNRAFGNMANRNTVYTTPADFTTIYNYMAAHIKEIRNKAVNSRVTSNTIDDNTASRNTDNNNMADRYTANDDKADYNTANRNTADNSIADHNTADRNTAVKRRYPYIRPRRRTTYIIPKKRKLDDKRPKL